MAQKADPASTVGSDVDDRRSLAKEHDAERHDSTKALGRFMFPFLLFLFSSLGARRHLLVMSHGTTWLDDVGQCMGRRNLHVYLHRGRVIWVGTRAM